MWSRMGIESSGASGQLPEAPEPGAAEKVFGKTVLQNLLTRQISRAIDQNQLGKHPRHHRVICDSRKRAYAAEIFFHTCEATVELIGFDLALGTVQSKS